MKMDTEEMTERLLAILNAYQEDLLTKMKEERRQANQDFLARMDTMFDAYEKRTMSCLGETDANTEEIDPGMMQSVEEHQDVLTEDVTVMPVKGLKKRRRGRKSTAGRRGEPKKLNRGNCGSRKKLAAACSKVSRHAAVVRRKRKLFRRTGTQEIF
jgi:hypothetical protein